MSGNGEKTDRRVQRTRDTLGDALVALMHGKDFDAITVQEVLDRAGVGRSTFYEHYSDKNDLFLSDVEEFFEMFSTVLTRRGESKRRLAPVAELFGHVRDEREFLMAMKRSGKLEDVLELGRGYFARSIEERLKGNVEDSVRRGAQASALAGSLFALLDWWVGRGMAEDPKEIDRLFHEMAWSGLDATRRT